MTEVDVSIPDGSSFGTNVQNADTNNTSIEQQQNGSPNSNTKEDSTEADGGVDTEEEDSQITSSTETNGGGDANATGKGGEDSSNIKQRLGGITIKSAKSINEDSSNACESTSQNDDSFNAKMAEDSVDSVNSRSEKSDVRSNDHDDTIDSPAQVKDTEAEAISHDGSAKSSNTDVDDTSNETSNHRIDPLADTSKENGSVSEKEKQKNNDDDDGVVDLGDDSDVEMTEMPTAAAATPVEASTTSAGNDSIATKTRAKATAGDSDAAVIIGSDSENENEKPSSTSAPKLVPMKITATNNNSTVSDDDDDDCVVIEDDTPAPNDLSKRKLDGGVEEPPNKRQRNSTAGTISIKDARTLTTPTPVEAIRKPSDVYPVNITTSGGIPVAIPGPPKLVPVAAAPIPAVSAITSLSGIIAANNSLLPGLTDDMFVLEAPSFIVPYIYEKPPSDNIKDVVKEIATKFSFTQEDLAEVDKTDEFDMMTEQNKEDREEKVEEEKVAEKKKKKRRGGEEADDSWSEQDDDQDSEDDDSESGTRTQVLIEKAGDDISAIKGAIKPASAVATSTVPATSAAKPGQENYFESPLGKFFMDIGVGLVQEFVQSDLIRLQKRKMRKSLGRNVTEFEKAIAALTANMEASKKKNSPFKFNMKRCEFCNFKSESALSMANHYETPHMNGVLYKCNFCIFEIRSATEIVYHMEAVHNIKARLIKPLPYHQCPNCGFEDSGKAKLMRHQPVCAKKFRPDINLAPPSDWEAPAKIPRIKPRHGLVGTATAYQAMAAQAAAQKAALASIQQQQQRNLQAAAAIAAQKAANNMRAKQVQLPMTKPGQNTAAMGRTSNQVRNPAATNVVMPNNYQLGIGGQPNSAGKKTIGGQPSISITPLPRQAPGTTGLGSPASTSKMPQAGIKPGQNPGGNKAQFVICEICDGYIKDLEQLRNHMQWMHKVKIHPKMIYNRPPLNCQKCQFRFFTDQGLERHLLGSHGLVTSSMQEAANKGKDAGRCPVCGRMYQWKLLNHVSRDHHMTLKPAHLSYKCTVCTATFGMYKQFETHVYTAHSTVAKKAMDGQKKNSPVPNAASSSSAASSRSSLSAANDSLLKPLKINDEITIIPQPATKRISNMDTHVID